ncbi:hypothetical protein VaNZ11_008720 [Volvox africanus]|uniref:Uncharacterized protein n=1 Tax=Volvox africanus TaxID=51714 RepID=A0ABQ5S5Q0_9CHLO|nr:hypothetical protein VaNZ11_008720 [Volvox africanus]
MAGHWSNLKQFAVNWPSRVSFLAGRSCRVAGNLVEPTAVRPGCRPSLPRSGACAAPLPAWHPHEVIMLSGYTESWGDGRERRTVHISCSIARDATSSFTPAPGTSCAKTRTHDGSLDLRTC